MVPQKEVQPPQEIVLRTDLTTADMVKVGRELMEGKGLCVTCHTFGKTGALRFPDLEGVGVRAKTRVPGLSDVEYFAQSMYEPNAYVVPGFNPGMPTINKPPIGLTDQEILCVIAYLQSLGGTPTVTLQTTHHYYTAPAAPAGTGGAGEMNILVVLAVAAAFGLLRFRRANLLTWAGAWWVGVYVLLRFGFTAPIPASVISIYMGIVSLAILAYVSSSWERREEVSRPLVRLMTEKRYTRAPRRNGRRHPGAGGRERLRPDERPPAASALLANGPSRIAFRDHGSQQEDRSRRRREPLPTSRDVESGRVPQTCRERAPGLLSELRLLPRRQHGRATACSCTGWTRSRPTSTDTIPMLRETFLFWRISKGGPGLPEEGGPWDTAMPAWEKFLKEEEMWEAILFLYDFTGQRPRAREEAAKK